VIRVVKYDSICARESVISAEGRRSNDVISDNKNSPKTAESYYPGMGLKKFIINPYSTGQRTTSCTRLMFGIIRAVKIHVVVLWFLLCQQVLQVVTNISDEPAASKFMRREPDYQLVSIVFIPVH
jgi:hypothetical protein